VEACPIGALTFGDMEDPNSKVPQLIASNKVKVIHPEYGLKEKVVYIGLPKRFIAGAVVFGDKDECAENVDVTLTGEGVKKTIKTNNYGDFEFEGLELEKEYSVRIEYPGYTVKEFIVKIQTDVYLGDIILT